MTCCGGLSGLDILQQVAQGSKPQQNSVLLHLMLQSSDFRMEPSYEDHMRRHLRLHFGNMEWY